MTIRCLLWDFGDTLCDERFIWGSGPEWLAVYETFGRDGSPAEPWDTGRIDTDGFAAELAGRLGIQAGAVVDHMVERSRHHIDFFDFTYRYFRDRHLPQAIVTVNPDLFSNVIVPAHDLDRACEVIVTSWEEGTIDKSVLCRVALDRLPVDCEPAQALLIDNKQHNLDDWAAVGGAGYLFTTDAAFRRDVETGALGLPPASAER